MIKNNNAVCDLRSAIDLLSNIPGELICTNTEVDSHSEIAGLYRYIGAGGTCKRPTNKHGPAVLFNKIKNYSNIRVAIGLMSNRKRVGYLLNCHPEKLGFLFKNSLKKLIKPKIIKDKPVCQDVVHHADNPNFDLRSLLPAITNTEKDAGPYLTMGMCYASDPENKQSDITIHRLCIQSHDTLSMWLTPGRHIDVFRSKAEKMGKQLPISINIGVDPAIEISSCFEPPTTPIGFNELFIAGAIRNKPVELVKCINIEEYSIANAEIVIEGEFIPNIRVREDQNTNTGKAMPEFSGYIGEAQQHLPVIKVKTVTHRKNPILQTTLGPSGEHVNMVGIPTEAGILNMLEKAMPGFVLNVHAHASGGGKLLAILQIKKSSALDEGKHRQAALIAFTAFPELKHVILVDDDVDIFDTDDVMWAMQTRYQGDIDTITIPGVRCHPLDPSQSPEYNTNISNKGITCKTIFDCTVPWNIKKLFQRATFKEVDVKKFFPNWNK